MTQRSLSNPEDWPENSGFDPRTCAPLISWISQMLFEVMQWIDTKTSAWVDPPYCCIGDMSINEKFLTFFHSNSIIWQISPYLEDVWPNALWKNPLPYEEHGWRLAADSASRVGSLASHMTPIPWYVLKNDLCCRFGVFKQSQTKNLCYLPAY